MILCITSCEVPESDRGFVRMAWRGGTLPCPMLWPLASFEEERGATGLIDGQQTGIPATDLPCSLKQAAAPLWASVLSIK